MVAYFKVHFPEGSPPLDLDVVFVGLAVRCRRVSKVGNLDPHRLELLLGGIGLCRQLLVLLRQLTGPLDGTLLCIAH